GAEATFVARTLDNDRAQLTSILSAAARHRGSALVEIYQNCPIFNDGAFDVLKEPGQKEQRLIPVEHGKPITFGTDGDHAVIRTDYGLDIAKTADVDAAQIVVHDATVQDPSYAFALSRLSTQDLAHVVTGVYRNVHRPTYDDQTRQQTTTATQAKTPNLQALLNGNDTWTVR
ncbi:MAG TPA: 2-oxoacid:ferredoxin oxidoreductase subunit beta, partial [Actinophytocola sp.]